MTVPSLHWLFVVFGLVNLSLVSAFPDGYLPVPGQRLMHTSCVHSWPDGSHVDVVRKTVTLPNNTVVRVPDCAHPPLPVNGGARPAPAPTTIIPSSPSLPTPPLQYYSGWVELVGDEYREELSFFEATWTVPPPPPNPFALTTIFLFNGVEANNYHNSSTILQPVLQWGISGCGGSIKSWSLASYIVVDIHAHCGGMLHDLSPGETIVGTMSRPLDSQEWTIVANTSTGASSHVSATPDMKQHWAVMTLEGIRVYGCGEFPGGTNCTFTGASLEMAGAPAKPNWNVTVHHRECQQHVIVDKLSGDVGLYWNSTPHHVY